MDCEHALYKPMIDLKTFSLKSTKTIFLVSILVAFITALILYIPEQFPLRVLEISAVIFGLIIGCIIRSFSVVTRQSFFSMWGMSAVTYFGISMFIEVLKYQPWHTLPLDGHLVNLFALWSVYNSPLMVYFVVLSLLSAVIPLLLSRHVWKNYRLLSKHQQ